MKNFNYLFVVMALLLSCPIFLNAQTIFVKGDAGGANNGTSWSDAYTNLQTAINVASAGNEIWVAGGIYKPSADSTGSTSPTDDRTKTFYIPTKNIKIYGGFAGTESTLSERILRATPTILSGDLDNDDKSNPLGVVESADSLVGNNTYHVVILGVQSTSFLFDGFTITAGKADGMSSDSLGGGLFHEVVGTNVTSSPFISNCLFKGNLATTGGAVYNTALAGNTCSTKFINVFFGGNKSTLNGGAIQNEAKDAATNNSQWINCVFLGNLAMVEGAGVNNEVSSVTGSMNNSIYFNCTFVGNKAPSTGRAINYGQPTGGSGLAASANVTTFIKNCILWNNYGLNSIDTNRLASFTIEHSVIENLDLTGIGTGNFNGNDHNASDPLFNGNTPTDEAPTCKGTARLREGSPCFDAGDTNIFPSDELDLDHDNNVNEFIPYDFTGNPRISSNSMVDIGAFENSGPFLRFGEQITGMFQTSYQSDYTPTAEEGTLVTGLAENCVTTLQYRIDNRPPASTDLELTGNPAISISGSSAFSIPTQPNDTTLQPDNGESFGILFTPSSTAAETCTLSIKTNDPFVPLLEVVITAQANGAAKRIYVDTTATGNNDGTSWANAYRSLHSAIETASVCDTIWVADGVYAPQKRRENSNDPADPFNRDFSYRIEKDFLMYGGFQGNETQLSQRDFKTYKTILSGDIDHNDLNTDGNFIAEDADDIQGNNAFIILRPAENVRNLVLDGFYITAGHSSETGVGNANSIGSGFFGNGGTINNCFFQGHKAGTGGAAMIAVQGVFSINNCVFSGNEADSLGGAVLAAISEDVTFTNCAFYANKSAAGAAVYNAGAKATFINCTISGNVDTLSKGAVHNADLNLGALSVATTTFINTVIWNNKDAIGIGSSTASVTNEGGSSFTASYSLLQGLNPTGTGNLDGTSAFNNPNFKMPFDDFNEIFDDIGDLCLQSFSPIVNKGDNTPNTTTLDLKCNDRIFDTTIDLGAYELQSANTCTPPVLSAGDITVNAGAAINIVLNSDTPAATYSWSGPNNFSATTQNPQVTGAAIPAHAGTYTVTATIATGCFSMTTLDVTVNTVSGGACTENDIIISTSPTTDSTYHAINTVTTNGNVIISKEITFRAGQSITLGPGFHAQAGHTFKAAIVSCSGLTIPDAPVTQRIDLVADKSPVLTETLGLEVAPNPFSSQTIIKYELPNAEIVSLAIYNMQGQLIQNLLTHQPQEAGQHQFQLNVETANNGLYFIGLKTQTGFITKKVMILK